MNKLRIAVVGVGLGGQIHIKRIKNSREVILDSIIAPNRGANIEIAAKEGVPIFHTISECIERNKPDGIIIASPNQVHAEQTRVCIEAEIPVLLEKPITSNLDEGRELCDLIERSNAKILVGHHRAHNSILKVASNAILEGRLGRLVSVVGSAQFYKPDHYFEDGPWRKVPGGGPILINMIHEIDNLRRLVGEISQVQAITSNSTRAFAVEDTAVINIVFKNGALGTFTLSDTAATARSWEQTTKENPGYPSYPEEDCYLISGTKGSLAIPTMKLKYYADGITPSWWTPFAEDVLQFSRVDPIELQLSHFADVINGHCLPLVTARDGYRNLLIIEAIKESAKKRSIIDVVE
jgi:predicted dehydrogenase